MQVLEKDARQLVVGLGIPEGSGWTVKRLGVKLGSAERLAEMLEDVDAEQLNGDMQALLRHVTAAHEAGEEVVVVPYEDKPKKKVKKSKKVKATAAEDATTENGNGEEATDETNEEATADDTTDNDTEETPKKRGARGPRKTSRSGGMNMLDACAKILKGSKKPMKAKDISEKMISQGLWSTEGKTPHATVAARLYVAIQKGDDRFTQPERGLFTVNR